MDMTMRINAVYAVINFLELTGITGTKMRGSSVTTAKI
jgi:hypothetical protein